MSSINKDAIVQGWHALAKGAGEAIQWISQMRHDAPRLDTEADTLTLKLRQSRNKARRLADAATRPMTIGFFGLSQAGKSYLISALAAGENGKLETCLGGKKLDFIQHINPTGNGKEATGLVTRFTYRPANGDHHRSVRLKLFSEAEVGKILTNAFLHDFDQEKYGWQFNESSVKALISQLKLRRHPQPVAGMTEDDVVSMWDYLKLHAEKSRGGLAHYFWPQAIELAPWLSTRDRGQLFSVLWGDVPELTAAYVHFADVLARLGQAHDVQAPLTALVREEDGMLIKAASIVNVDTLERLYRAEDSRIDVCPIINNQPGSPVAVTLAELAALTVELEIPLENKPREPLFEQVDLLDFPGYRGRMNVVSLNDVTHDDKYKESNPLAQLFLRGKVAYLFERYSESQEMNVLVVCTASTKQSEVNEVGAVLDAWINQTQGSTPEIRERRKPGLVWALTMFDQCINQSLNTDEAALRQAWGLNGLIKLTMSERFGHYKWMQEWHREQPFNNTFLVRKPRHPSSFINIVDNQEVEFIADQRPQLDVMRRTFIADKAINRYVQSPAEAWDAMLTLNDGGMARMAAYLRQVARLESKLERINEQLEEEQNKLTESGLSGWYQPDGEEDTAKKAKIAAAIQKVLLAKPDYHGELLQHLLPPRNELRELYLQELTLSEPAGEEAEDTFGGLEAAFDQLFNSSAPVTIVHSHEQQFASQAAQLWITHLRGLNENPALLNYIGLPREIIESLTDELITALLRLKIDHALKDALLNTEQAAALLDEMVERQVSRVLHIMGDFVTWLGFQHQSFDKRPTRPRLPDQPIFSRPPQCDSVQWIGDEQLVRLPQQQINYTAIFFFDWLIGLDALIKGNAGHSAGREISAEQNAQLGRVIRLIKSQESLA